VAGSWGLLVDWTGAIELVSSVPVRTSILTLAYNHEQWLAQAIESVLAQADGDWEYVIAEDCSTDRTREIAREYAAREPRIRLLESEVNVGARTNFLRALATCQGRYLALLDGDDYWTSPDKLSRQADLLDATPGSMTCFHGWQQVGPEGEVLADMYPRGRKKRYQLAEILANNPAASCTVLYRLEHLRDLPDWFETVPVGDWPMHVLCAQHGEGAFIEEVMAAHRVHAGGRWAGKDSVQQMEVTLETQRVLLEHAEPGGGGPLSDAVAKDDFRRARASMKRGERDAARGYLQAARLRSPRAVPFLRSWSLSSRIALAEFAAR
jgi:hypothetical protein